MTANKIFFDTFWRPNQKDTETVFVVLRDAKIYTEVSRAELFDKGMYSGCLLEARPSDTRKEAKAAAMRLTHAIGAKRVTPSEFIEIEKQQEAKRVAHAFAIAEEMIASN